MALAGRGRAYDEMVDQMGKVAKMDVELTVEERNRLHSHQDVA